MLTPDGGTEPSDRPVVVRVTSRQRVEPALVVAAVALSLVGVALWKPWVQAVPDAESASPRTTGPAAAVASNPPQPTAPASTPRPAGAAVAPALPALDGLDLSFMGTEDLHAAWGIAVAYAPIGNIARAAAGHLLTFTPVVDWVALPGDAVPRPTRDPGPLPTDGSGPGPGGPGPIMDHPLTVTIAVAVTWPPMPRPRAVRLFQTGTIASVGGDVSRLPTSQLIALAEPLPLLARLQVGPAPGIAWQLMSGTFYLPSEGPPIDAVGWLTGGWSPGAYAFVVTQADGSNRTLPFVLRG